MFHSIIKWQGLKRKNWVTAETNKRDPKILVQWLKEICVGLNVLKKIERLKDKVCANYKY